MRRSMDPKEILKVENCHGVSWNLDVAWQPVWHLCILGGESHL